MKRVIVDIVFVLVCFVLQCTVFQSWAMADISPNLLIVVVSSVGFMRGKTEGMLMGFFSGLLIDICYGDMLGFYALIYMYIGYVNGFFQSIFYEEDLKLPMILITVSDFVYGLIIYVFLFLLRNRTDFFYYLLHVIIPELVYTVVVTIVLYRLILLVYRKLDTSEKRSAGRNAD
ncbi:MAG: rod shape-determining protein MreD [Lachnospiraceae bacterium]|nr:rod shape-determining protein MreD [Lachnospiraceae bacterium]